MAHQDPMQAREQRRRYREKQKIKKYGPSAAGRDMRGRHGNHARGSKNARWNSGKLRTAHGYVLVRVAPTHPRAFGPPRLTRFKYAYEHDIVMERSLGRHLRKGEVVHHLNGHRDDNRPENLLVKTVSQHARGHVARDDVRDSKGRFNSNVRH